MSCNATAVPSREPVQPSRGAAAGWALVLAVAAVAFALLWAADTRAAQTHPFLENIDPAGTPNGFVALAGIAVEQGGGDLYVVDSFGAPDFSGAVDRFDPSGAFQNQITGAGTPQGSLSGPADVALDESGGPSDGNVYVTDSGNNLLDAFDSAGNLVASFATGGQLDGSETPIGAFSTPCAVAVDQSNGDVYLADAGNNRIWIFDETGAYLGRIAESSLQGPCGLALDSAGHVYVRNQNSANVVKFAKAGPLDFEFAAVLDSNNATDVAVDASSDRVYVDNGTQVTVYDSAGAQLFQFGAGVLEGSGGIGVDSGTGRVYASDGGALRVFGPSVTVPDVVTGEATEVEETSATLNGTVDLAGGPDASCRFEYAPFVHDELLPPYEAAGSVPCAENPVSGSGPVAVSAIATDLEPGIRYRFRLLADNGQGGSRSVATGPSQRLRSPSSVAFR